MSAHNCIIVYPSFVCMFTYVRVKYIIQRSLHSSAIVSVA